MFRSRKPLIAVGIAAVLSILACHAIAQPPGRGGPGGPRRPGGPGGPGGSILDLVQNAALQVELKVKDAQKTKIQTLAEMAERFAAMRETETALDQEAEQALAKILDRGQYGRLKQVQLQVEGVAALLRPDMIEKLGLEEEQVQQIRELVAQSFQAQRENGRALLDMMRNLQVPATQEAMKAFMDKPETKAKLEQIRTESTRLQNQLTAAVNRILTRRQAAAYKKMLGKPFEVSLVWGGPGQAPGNRPANANPADRSAASGKTQASDSGEDKAGATSKSAPTSKAKGSTAKTKKKSLRGSRSPDE